MFAAISPGKEVRSMGGMTIGKVVLVILGVVGFVVIQTFIAAQDSSTWGISGTIISYVPLAFSIGILISAFKGSGGKK